MRRVALCFAVVVATGCDRGSKDPTLDAQVVATHNAAVAAMGSYDYDGAMSLIQPIVEAHPGWNQGHVDLAIAQLNRQAEGDEGAALSRLLEVLSRNPGDLRARYCAGLLRLNAGDVEQAADDFAAVAAADPTDAYAVYYLGQSRSQLGDFEDAVAQFARAVALDPYLRSTYYAGAQAARRAGNVELAQEWLDVFHRMEHNPRARLAEIKYTRMGPKATVLAIQSGAAALEPRPAGPIFADPRVIGQAGGPITAMACGWVGDGRSLVLLAREDGVRQQAYTPQAGLQDAAPQPEAGIGTVAGVAAPLWGDVNGDGHLDVVLCRSGRDQLWLGTERGVFEQDDRFPGDTGDAVDGALFDADHDGDLDVLVVSRGEPASLLNNNGDGTWQQVTDEASGFPGAMVNGRQVVVADLDGDLDTDVLLIGEAPPHAAWLNDRLWQWQAAPEEWASLLHAPIAAAVAADVDADGVVDVVTIDRASSLRVWNRAGGVWAPEVLAEAEEGAARPRRLAVADVTGDGGLDVLVASPGTTSIQVLDRHGSSLQKLPWHAEWLLVQGRPSAGPSLLLGDEGGEVAVCDAGSGRFSFVDVTLSGRTDTGQSMRSNVSGIGATVAARTGTRWTLMGAVRSSAGPGQSLQPISIGLGGASVIDFVSIDWTDGVFQTESMLQPGVVHSIVETQRQLSSCPVIFAWDGDAMRFQTDCLGVGGIGFLLGPGTYAPPRPRERVLLTGPTLAPRAGALELLLAEPMQETCYLDSAVLEVIDLPDDWEVLPDERMGTASPLPSSELLYARRSFLPVAATGPDGDVLNEVRRVDGAAVDPGTLDGRFLGRLEEPLRLELEFGRSLAERNQRVVLVIDGWVEYPYSQTMFAAWQAGRTYRPLTIEARGKDGVWRVVHEDVGYPAGMTRRCVLPLDDLPSGASAIRLTSDLEVYIDAARVAVVETPPEVEMRDLEVLAASLEDVGYPHRRLLPDRRPGFDWARRVPFWDVRSQRGEYTRLGAVGDLVSQRDGVLAVFGAGEAIRLRFRELPPPQQGWTRHHVLDLSGWCKDMDLMTRSGGTVEPIPEGRTPRRDRHRSGR